MSERWSLFAPENSQLLEEARQKYGLTEQDITKMVEMIDAVQEVKTQVVAHVAETFQWCPFAHMRGIVFTRGGTTLPGMIVLHVGEEAAGFETEWKRYSTQHHMAIYEYDTDGNVRRDDKGNRVQIGLVSGAFSDMTRDEAWNAIGELISSEVAAT